MQCSMKRDIETPADVKAIIDAFYEAVNTNDVLQPYFVHMTPAHWEAHLPVMYQFWENVVFYSGGYTGNPMATHARLHSRIPLSEEAFKRWAGLMMNTIDEMFAGERANLMKRRAESIAAVMRIKILGGQV